MIGTGDAELSIILIMGFGVFVAGFAHYAGASDAVGALLAVYFASNGVEALRVALNRAYAVTEPRSWYWLRLAQEIGASGPSSTRTTWPILISLGSLASR